MKYDQLKESPEKRVSPSVIQECMGELEGTIKDLGSMVDVLRNSLGTILTPEEASPEPAQDVDCCVPQCSDLAYRIQMATARVSELMGALCTIKDRSEC